MVLFLRRNSDWRAASSEHEAELSNGLTDLHCVLLERLGRGACFIMDLIQASERVGSKLPRDRFESALWDLVWSGRITNDTFAPLRGLAGNGGGVRTPGRCRAPALAGGRWSLVADLAAENEGSGAPTETARVLALARMLLERYGVVSREAVQGEGVPGGFAPLYRVLKQMEESGQVRRGYFVEGLSGAQFALAGALDRLRAARVDEPPMDGFSAEDVRTLSAIDPANPYGTLLPWPETGTEGFAPRRRTGALVILVAGQPVLYLGSGGRTLSIFPGVVAAEGNELALALAAIQALPGRKCRRLLIQQINGIPAIDSPLRGALLAAGFEVDSDALVPSVSGVPTGSGRDGSVESRAPGRGEACADFIQKQLGMNKAGAGSALALRLAHAGRTSVFTLRTLGRSGMRHGLRCP